MTTRGPSVSVESGAACQDELSVRRRQPGNAVIRWLATAGRKTIGTLYLSTSFAFFAIGGIMALVMRAEPARPGAQTMSNEQHHHAFTMHGTVMLLMFATPLSAGLHGTFPVQHWLGAEDMPRRYADCLAAEGFTGLKTISTSASFLLGLSMLPFLHNVRRTAEYGKEAEAPWDYGRSLEWVASCPPPRRDFLALPRIRSESPVFDLRHPSVRALEDAMTHPGEPVTVAPGDKQV